MFQNFKNYIFQILEKLDSTETQILIVVSIVVVLFVLYKLIDRSIKFFIHRKVAKTEIREIIPDDNKEIKKFYELQELLTPPEFKLFQIIDSSINKKKYYIIPQTSILSLLNIKFENNREAWNKVSNRRLDFLITDKNFRPILAIELDDKSHEKPERQKRDLEVEEVLSGIGLKMIRFKMKALDYPELIQKKIKKNLK